LQGVSIGNLSSDTLTQNATVLDIVLTKDERW